MRAKLSLFLALVLVLALVGPATADAPRVETGAGEWGGLVFVELTGRPLADGGTLRILDGEHGSFQAELGRSGIKVKPRYAYKSLFNGFSLEIATADLAALARLKGVKAIWPVVEFPIPELFTSTDMLRVPDAYDEFGYDGAGVLVAIIDTGIDYNHPDLGGGFGPGFRVVGGWDFVGDAFNAGDPANRTPYPDPDPMDINGHGTHVSGIVGASGTTRGVAPGVDFLALKVFGATGSTTADVMLAAMEMALSMGADVVNMSIGAAYQWPQYPTAVGADRLVNKGLAVVVSQGNNGPQGLFAGGAPALGSKVLAVASFDNTHAAGPIFRLPDGTPVGYNHMTFAPNLPTAGTSPEVVYVGLGNSAADYAGKDAAGKVVLCSRGVEPFRHKVLMAQARGAVACVIHNNAPGNFSGTMGEPGDYIPAASISLADGIAIRDLVAAGPVTLTWTDEKMSFPNPTAGQISSFSSWGPSPDLALKPDLGAPGGSVYAPYPLAKGGYATLSGTSMSAPHVAGAAALLLQANPRLNPNALADTLRNTAVPQNFNPLYLLAVHRQGAGMADVLAALTAGARIEPSKVSLGEVTGPAAFALTIENKRDTPVTFTLSHAPALATNNNILSPGLALAYATAAFPAAVTLAPGEQATVEVTVNLAATTWLFGGYIRFTPDDGGPVLSVPYCGFRGDYLAAPVLGSGPYAFPWLASLVGSSYFKAPAEGLTINPQEGEYAYILFNLFRQARKVRVEVLNAATGRAHGRVLDIDYMGRSSANTAFFAWAWDGSGRNGPVPAGTYVLRLSVQKPLGDDDNPAHWDTWTSGPVTVIRP
ncbi:MAG: S8 family serine peptidase [bacterium]|nr:S8 family serine peptidase [bacterium]